MQYVTQLDKVSQYDLMTVGGKAANLGELINAGFPVPPGFVVLTSAYDSFVTENSLQSEIEGLAQTVSLTGSLHCCTGRTRHPGVIQTSCTARSNQRSCIFGIYRTWSYCRRRSIFSECRGSTRRIFRWATRDISKCLERRGSIHNITSMLVFAMDRSSADLP